MKKHLDFRLRYISPGMLSVIIGCSAFTPSQTASSDTCWSYNSNNLINSCTGNVGIGTTNPLASLNIATSVAGIPVTIPTFNGSGSASVSVDSALNYDTVTALPSTTRELAAMDYLLLTSPSNSAKNFFAHSSQAVISSSSINNVSGLYGSQSASINFGTGTVALQLAIFGNAENETAASVGEMTGGYFSANNDSTGAVSIQEGLNVFANNNGAGTVSEQYGAYVSTYNQSGTVTDTYVLYLTNENDGVATNVPYDLYASDAASYNYFAGNVGIGTTSPQASLDIVGMYHLSSNSSAPAACASALDGNVARTSHYTFCVCKGGSTSWVSVNDGTTSCTW